MNESLEELRLLVVEDNEDHQELIRRCLHRQSEFAVTDAYADSVEEADAQLEKGDFDAMFLDLSLPKSRPEETLEHFAEGCSDLPTIILTSLGDDELADKALSLGYQDFLEKTDIDIRSIPRVLLNSIRRKDTMQTLMKENAALRAFSHFIAHEIRNPLQAISNALYIADAQAEHAEKVKKACALGSQSAELLSALVKELLQFAEFDAADSLTQTEVFSIGPLLEEILRDEPFCHLDDEVITVRGGTRKVQGSRLQIRQVITNLLSNAVKYARVEPLRIILEARKTNDSVKISVSDNGVGIPMKDQLKIFSLFYRADETSVKKEGSGIGLAFCRQIVERHGGHLKVESKEGQGTRFRFSLPSA